MAKLKLVAAPTFKARVSVPVAGGEAVEVEFTFKHRTKTQLTEWIRTRGPKLDDKDEPIEGSGPTDLDSFLDMVSGWEIDEPFTQENVELLLEHYIGTATATYRVYVDQLTGARLGNSVR